MTPHIVGKFFKVPGSIDSGIPTGQKVGPDDMLALSTSHHDAAPTRSHVHLEDQRSKQNVNRTEIALSPSTDSRIFSAVLLYSKSLYAFEDLHPSR